MPLTTNTHYNKYVACKYVSNNDSKRCLTVNNCPEKNSKIFKHIILYYTRIIFVKRDEDSHSEYTHTHTLLSQEIHS